MGERNRITGRRGLGDRGRIGETVAGTEAGFVGAVPEEAAAFRLVGQRDGGVAGIGVNGFAISVGVWGEDIGDGMVLLHGGAPVGYDPTAE